MLVEAKVQGVVIALGVKTTNVVKYSGSVVKTKI